MKKKLEEQKSLFEEQSKKMAASGAVLQNRQFGAESEMSAFSANGQKLPEINRAVG